MTRVDTVKKAIAFQSPPRVPVWFFNRDQMEGDVLAYDLRLDAGARSEWGYEWEQLGDGTMGQPSKPVFETWEDAAGFKPPALREAERMAKAGSFIKDCGDRYRLATFGISGFTVYTFLRGFENSMMDFMLEPDKAGDLLDKVFDFECDVIQLAAKQGFHGIHFADDWGTQQGLIISRELWRQVFGPRYRAQFKLIHDLGMQVWYHCCGNVTELLGDFHEVGVDVMNLSQPNVMDIEAVGREWRGKMCFMVPISYQTVSIRGTPSDIEAEAARLLKHLATPRGGFIGYVEEYASMGMSEVNYRACAEAWH